MDNVTILAFLSNLINGQNMDYLNDPYSRMGIQNTLQLQQQNQMLADQDVARLLDMARGIDTRATIPTRSVGSIFQPEPSYPTVPKLESATLTAPNRMPTTTQTGAAYPNINTTGFPTGMPMRNPAAEIYQGPTYNRIPGRDRQQLSNVGGIFPATLKDYYIPVFQPRVPISRGRF